MSYKCLSNLAFCFVVLQIVIATPGTIPSTVQFTCDETGNIKSIENLQNHQIQVIDESKICLLKSNVDVRDCAQKKTPNLKIHYEVGKHDPRLEGGQGVDFFLKCEYQAYVGHAQIAMPVVGSPSPSTYQTVIVPITNKEPVLEITDENGATISGAIATGKHLKLKMSITVDNLVISPTICFAINAVKSQENVTIWKHCDDEHQDYSIIPDDKWIASNNQSVVDINMYAFHFVDSTTTTIECFANICPIGGKENCGLTCNPANAPTTPPTTTTQVLGRRRRRESPKEAVVIKSSKVSFEVISDIESINSAAGQTASLITSAIFSLGVLIQRIC